MSAQIITFPIKNGRVLPEPPPDEDAVTAAADNMKLAHVHETLMSITPMLFERLMAAGFDFSDYKSESELKYGSFLIESIHSLLCQYYDVYHPFQDVAEKIFVKDDHDELQVVDELQLKFIETKTES